MKKKTFVEALKTNIQHITQKASSGKFPLEEVANKYNAIAFNSLNEYNNYKLLMETLESIECLESVFELKEYSIEKAAFIILNWQFIGAAQEQLGRSFTMKYPRLSEISFANAIGNRKGASWLDRLTLAHTLNIDHLFEWINKEQGYIQDSCVKLKEEILNIFTSSACLLKSSQVLIDSSIRINIKAEDYSISDRFMYDNVKDSNKYLLNILRALEYSKNILTGSEADKSTFKESLGKQALVLLIQEVIGNNVKELAKLPNNPISSEKYKDVRNRIAHTKLLRNLVENPDRLWREAHTYLSLEKEIEQILDVEYNEKRLSNSLYYELYPSKKPIDESTKEEEINVALQMEQKIIGSHIHKPSKEEEEAALNEAIRENLSIVINKRTIYEKLTSNERKRILFCRIISRDIDDIELLLKLGVENLDEPIVWRKIKQIGKKVFYAIPLTDIKKDPSLLALNFDCEDKDIPQNIPLTALSVAASIGMYEACKLLISYGANVNVSSMSDIATWEPISHSAVIQSDRRIFDLLLENGANPDAVDENGISVLSYVLSKGDIAKAKLLLKYNAEIERTAQCKKDGVSFTIPTIASCITHSEGFLPTLINEAVNLGGLGKLKRMLTVNFSFNYPIFGITIMDPMGLANIVGKQQAVDLIINCCYVAEYSDKYPLHTAVLLGDINVVNEFFKNKEPAEICAHYRKKIELDVASKVPCNMFTAFELAKKLEHTEIANELQKIGMEALQALKKPADKGLSIG